MKKLLLSLLAVVSISSVSHADILLEPYMGLIVTGKNSTDSSAKFSGNNLGARVGWSMLGFAVGVDALLAGTTTVKSDSGTNDLKPSGVGIFGSYTFPILVRGYFSYVPTFTAKTDFPTGEAVFTGTVTKIGVQYTGLPFVAFGIEFQTINNNKMKLSGVEDATFEKNTISLTNLVVSAPFSL